MGSGNQVHLVVLIHGLWGSPAHLAAAKQELEDAWGLAQGGHKTTSVSGPSEDPTITTMVPNNGMELVVVVAGGMTSQLTYDGIDVCASRVAWEVGEQVKKLEEAGKAVSKFSVMGYSLGGLVARYLVGLLDAQSPSFFDGKEAYSFSTIATPHLGIPRYNTFLSPILYWCGARLLSRSGEQLYVSDQYSDQDSRPLLEIMADPNLTFHHALQKFHTIRLFANGIHDHTVPYPTAAIDTEDPFVDWEQQGLQVDADENDLIRTWTRPQGTIIIKRKGVPDWVGTLPPVLRFRFPFNYLILLLFPIFLPLVVILMIGRLSLDTRRSRQRLKILSTSGTDLSSASSGLSVQGLRDLIKRVERDFESEIIESLDGPETLPLLQASDDRPAKPTVQLQLSDTQRRIAFWLNSLPLEKFVSWYPDVSNSHAVAIVRDPARFLAHNRGRGLLKRWAQGVIG